MAFGVRLVPEAARFLALFPEVNLHVDLTDRRVNLIEEGFDVPVRVGELRDAALASRARPLPPVRAARCPSAENPRLHRLGERRVQSACRADGLTPAEAGAAVNYRLAAPPRC